MSFKIIFPVDMLLFLTNGRCIRFILKNENAYSNMDWALWNKS